METLKIKLRRVFRGAGEMLAAGFLYLLIICGVMEKALHSAAGMVLSGIDIRRYIIFIFQFLHDAFSKGEFPWWNPYLLGGLPYVSHPKSFLWYPVNWILITNSDPILITWYAAAHIVLAAITMYWLCRKVLSIGPIPAWFSGAAFGLSGFFFARLWAGHTTLIATAAWTPFVYGMCWRVLTSNTRVSIKRIVMAVGAVVLIYISGYQTLAVISYEAIGIAAVILSIFRRNLLPFMRYMAIMVLSFGVLSSIILPNQQFINRSIQSGSVSYDWAASGSLQPKYLFELVKPFFFGNQNTFFGQGLWYHERAAFIGVSTILLAIGAIIITLLKTLRLLKKKTDENMIPVIVLVIIASFAVWISLGTNAPIDLFKILYSVVPIYQKLRIPTRHMILFVFSVSALAGVGLHLIKQKIVQCIAVCILLIELIPFAHRFIDVTLSPDAKHDKDLIAILLQDRSYTRLVPNYNWASYPTDSFDFNEALANQIFSTGGYETAQLNNYFEFIESMNNQTISTEEKLDAAVVPLINRMDSPYFYLLGGNYVIVASDSDTVEHGGFTTYQLILKNSHDTYRLYKNPDAYQRFWFVPALKAYGSREEIKAAIRSISENPKAVVLVEKRNIPDNVTMKPNCTGGYYQDINITSYFLNSIELSVTTPCNVFLASSEVMYPGWTAFIDGKKTNVFEGNLAFRTIYVPAGTHTIVYRFIPTIFLAGGAVTLLTIGVCIVLIKKNFSL